MNLQNEWYRFCCWWWHFHGIWGSWKKISSSHKPTHHHTSAKVQSTVNKQKRSSKSAHSFLSILRTPRDTIITFMPIITLLLLILAKNFSEPSALTSSWQIRRQAPLTQFPISIKKSIQPTVRLICLLLTYVLTRSNGLYEWSIKLKSPKMGCCCCKSKMLIGFNPEIRNTSVNVQQCVAHLWKNVCCSSSKGPPISNPFYRGSHMNRVPLVDGPPSCPSNETRDDDDAADAAIGTNDVPHLKELHKHFLATIP